MDAPLLDLLTRIDRVSGRFPEVGRGLRQALEIADRDPEMALTRLRKVLEFVVRALFERLVPEKAGTRPLDNLIQRLAKDGHLPDLIQTYASGVRTLGNVGTHTFGEEITCVDVFRSLDQLAPIVDWFLEGSGFEPAGLADAIRALDPHCLSAPVTRARFTCQRVYVGSAGDDLSRHRQAVREEVAAMGWQVVVFDHLAAPGGGRAETCRREVETSDLLLAFARGESGPVPAGSEWGDGARGLASSEVDAARRRGVPSRFFRPEELLLDEAAFRAVVRERLWEHRAQLIAGAIERERAAASPARPVGPGVVQQDLEAILGGLVLPRRALTHAFDQSAPRGWAPHPAEGNPVVLLSECVRSLARAPRQQGDGAIPLVRFVSLLAEQVGGPAAARLHDWLNQALDRLTLDEDDRARAVAIAIPALAPAKPEPRPHHLLVQVAPRRSEPGLYSFKAWLFGVDGPACLRAGEEKVARADLPGCLGDVLAELPSREIDPESAWVELILPRELLCDDVDQWALDFGLIPISLGVEHRLCVRSFERSSQPRAVQALQKRWQSLRAQPECRCRLTEPARLAEEPTSSLAVWVESEGGGQPLYAALQGAKDLAAAVLGCPPSPAPADPRSDVLNTLLQAGVPVVLWARRHPPGGMEALRGKVAGLLDADPLHRLPDQVWDLRKRAATDADEVHLGRHLTLLWDDPARTSPDFDPKFRLQPPTPAG